MAADLSKLKLAHSTKSFSKSRLATYSVAVALVFLAWASRTALTALWGPTAVPFIFFYPAIVITAWYGRRGPALLAIALSALAANWFFIEPRHSFSFSHTSEAVALIAFVFVDLILVGAIELMHIARERLADELEQRLKTEAQLAAEKELLETTLTSIGDAVIVTDEKGMVLSLNGEAQHLTGWQSQEALGKPLAEIFHIVNEQTREPAESPVEKVLRLGIVTDLANHTIVISRDGRETPIDDSAAPIRHDTGPILGVVLVFRDVTEQRRALQERARLAAIVEYSGDAIFTKNINGTIDTWNESAQRLFGYSAEEIIGKPVTTLIPADRQKEEDGIIERLRAGQPSESFETVRVTKDGTPFPALVSVSPLKDADGNVIGASKIVHNISELVAKRDELKREKELLATTLACIGDAVILTDDKGLVTFLNSEAEALTAWTNEEACGHPLNEVFNIINEKTGERVENPVEKVVRIGGVVGLANHTVLIAKDGREIPIDDSAAPIRYPGGPMFGVVLVFRDFTERRRAEETLREREERFHTMADGAPVMIWLSGLDKLCTWFNRQWLEFTGRTMEQELGNGWAEGVHPDDLDRCLKTYVEAFDNRQPFSMEYRLKRHDGEWRWVLDTGTPTYEANNKFAGYIGSCIDMTDLKHSSEALRQIQARLTDELSAKSRLQELSAQLVPQGELKPLLQAILAAAADLTGTDKGNIQIYDPQTEKLRIFVHQGLGRRLLKHFAEDGWVATCAQAASKTERVIVPDVQILEALRGTVELEIVMEDGIRSIQSTPLISRDGRLLGMLNNHYRTPGGPDDQKLRYIDLLARQAADLIERHQAEQALLVKEAELERLFAREQELRETAEDANRLKDEFLAIMSHELRNPLNVISGYSELLVRNEVLIQFPQVHRMADAIRRNAKAQSKLISDLLDLSRLRSGKLELNREIVSLIVSVNNAIDTVSADAQAKDITIQFEQPDESLFVDGDPVRLAQIVWNLLNNSVKFSQPGGHIIVRLAKEKDHVTLTVEDNGQGIDPTFLPYIFELFRQADQSTTRSHTGMGIGLAVVQQLVELHNGSISAYSAGFGKGAQFTVKLPLSLEIKSELAPVLDLTKTLEHFSVLVVDDSEDTAEMLAQVLKLSGANVISATSGNEALGIIADNEFDVVLSDISMPGMDGFEFLRHLRQIPGRADVPVLALTGFGRPEDVERAKNEGFFSHLTKPFDLDVLMEILKRVPQLKHQS